MMRGAIVAAVVVLLLAGCDSGSDEPDAEPNPTTSASASATETADPGPVVECPGTIIKEKDPALPDAVPEGATSVRLCDGGDDRVPPPADALTSDVAAIVDAVNRERVVQLGCVDLRNPEYQLAFGYPDGTSFVVTGRFTGCAELLVGSVRRARALPPMRAFVDALRTQRADATPPDLTIDADDLDCGRPPSILPAVVAKPTDLTVAVLCYGRPEHPGRASRVEIPSDDLTLLTRSMSTEYSSSAGALGCGPLFSRRDHWIVGVSAWGDPIVMRRGCYGLVIEGSDEWDPRRQARAILKRLVSEAR